MEPVTSEPFQLELQRRLQVSAQRAPSPISMEQGGYLTQEETTIIKSDDSSQSDHEDGYLTQAETERIRAEVAAELEDDESIDSDDDRKPAAIPNTPRRSVSIPKGAQKPAPR